LSGSADLTWCGVGLAALAVNLAGVGAVRRWALARSILDVPNARSSHTLPTPRGGGVVLVVVTLGGAGICVAAGLAERSPGLLWAVVGAVIVALVSWLEDIHHVRLAVRLGAQAVAAALALAGIGSLPSVELPFAGVVEAGWVGIGLAVFWIVGLANAVNFMDGIDGIAGGQALVAAVGWLALATPGSVEFCVAVLLASGALGFLCYNWAPARIFMGDVGAVFLGFCFAVLPLLAGRNQPRMVLAGALLVWPFLFDTSFTLLRRLRRGENIFDAHRSHLYQRLVLAGRSHAHVSAVYIVMAALGMGLALSWSAGGSAAGASVVAVPACAALGLWWYTLWAERASEGSSGSA
jgi:Fuc2NAc and GlcNAc transferase